VAVEEGDDIVGFVSFFATGPYMHLEELGVRRESQGRGIGTALLELLISGTCHSPKCWRRSCAKRWRPAWTRRSDN
jgi:GNAT superfamily N-acetyltransferase